MSYFWLESMMLSLSKRVHNVCMLWMLQDSEDEKHKHQIWYHGKLQGGRDKAQELLQQYRHLGDGTFLVRHSENFIGDYTLSFW